MRFGLIILVAMCGCATPRAAVAPRQGGAALVLDTTLGARAGELFAASDDELWLCRDHKMQKIVRLTLMSAVVESTGHDVDVTRTEVLRSMARHPEGLPYDGASCGLAHVRAHGS